MFCGACRNGSKRMSGINNPIGVVKSYGDHSLDPSNQIGTINFGTVHVGDVGAFGYSIGNIAGPIAYPLNGAIGVGNPDDRVTGSGVTAGSFSISPGGGWSDKLVTLNASHAGSINTQIDVGFDGTQPDHPIQLTGNVLNYADPQFLVREGSSTLGLPITEWGNTSYVDLGTFYRGQRVDPLTVNVLNAANAPSDMLWGYATGWQDGRGLTPHDGQFFGNLGSGDQAYLGAVDVNTSHRGTNVGVIDLHSLAWNAGGYVQWEPDKYLVVTDRVV